MYIMEPIYGFGAIQGKRALTLGYSRYFP